MLHYFVGILHFSNTWFYITSGSVLIAGKHFTFYDEPASFFFTFFNRSFILFHCIGINQRPYVIIFIQRISNFQLAVCLN